MAYRDCEDVPLLGNRENHEDHFNQRAINCFSLSCSILVFGLVVCYPVAMAIGKTLPMDEMKKIKKSLPPECIPTIDDSDKEAFLNDVVDEKSRLIYVNLTVNLNHVCVDCPAFTPRSWVWVSADSSEVSTFLGWQEDYAIWSFGILDIYATRDVQILLNVSSSCEEKFGEATDMVITAETLNNMTESGLSHLKQDYNDSMWCYRKKLNTLTHTEKQFVRNFRYFVQDLGTVCFKLRNNRLEYKLPQRFWTDIPFGFTYIALLFSPLIFIYLLHVLSNNPSVPWLSWGGGPSEEVPQNDSYIYQGFKSPVTFSSILSELLPKTFWNSRKLHFLVKLLLLILSPFVIYIKFLIYDINSDFHFLLARQIDHGISIGFSSMLFSFDQQSKNFLTFIGGPTVLIVLYYVLGLGLIILDFLFDPKVTNEETENKSEIPLASLHLKKMMCIQNNTLENKILNVIAENSVKHTLTCTFWKHVWQVDRIWQIPFSFVFHLIPFLFTSHLIMKTNMMCIADKCQQRRCLVVFFCFLLGIVHFVFLFCFITIFFASFEFLALIVTFCYIAMVTYPTESVGYFVFAMATLYYLCHCLREIAQKYQHLLIQSVEVSKELVRDILPMKLSPHLAHSKCLRHGYGSWGIPKSLFEKIIAKYEPKPVSVMMAIVKMVFVLCVLAWTLRLVFRLHNSQSLDPIMHIFSTVLVVSLPNLIRLLTSDFSKETRDTICKVHLQSFIEKYWSGYLRGRLILRKRSKKKRKFIVRTKY